MTVRKPVYVDPPSGGVFPHWRGAAAHRLADVQQRGLTPATAPDDILRAMRWDYALTYSDLVSGRTTPVRGFRGDSQEILKRGAR